MLSLRKTVLAAFLRQNKRILTAEDGSGLEGWWSFFCVFGHGLEDESWTHQIKTAFQVIREVIFFNGKEL